MLVANEMLAQHGGMKLRICKAVAVTTHMWKGIKDITRLQRGSKLRCLLLVIDLVGSHLGH